MPDPAICNKIKDPAERKKCLGYKGKYAKASPVKASPVTGSLKKPTSGTGY